MKQEILMKEGKLLPVMEHFYTIQASTLGERHILSVWLGVMSVAIGVM